MFLLQLSNQDKSTSPHPPLFRLVEFRLVSFGITFWYLWHLGSGQHLRREEQRVPFLRPWLRQTSKMGVACRKCFNVQKHKARPGHRFPNRFSYWSDTYIDIPPSRLRLDRPFSILLFVPSLGSDKYFHSATFLDTDGIDDVLPEKP